MHLHHARITSKLAGKRFGSNTMSREEVQASIDIFSEYFYFINPKEDFTLDAILDAAKQLVKKKGIKAFVIDAYNKLDHQYEGSETQYISRSLDKIAMFCMRYGVHAFIVAHPTKMKKDEQNNFLVPTLYDISGSAHFYNKTHNGITIYKRKIENDVYITEIHVQKVKFKHWGKEGVVSMTFDYNKGGRFMGNTVDNRNYLLPPEKDPSSTYTQSALPMEVEKSRQVRENTNFLNVVEDELSNYKQFDTEDNGEVPF
jgi:twinkle protein